MSSPTPHNTTDANRSGRSRAPATGPLPSFPLPFGPRPPRGKTAAWGRIIEAYTAAVPITATTAATVPVHVSADHRYRRTQLAPPDGAVTAPIATVRPDRRRAAGPPHGRG